MSGRQAGDMVLQDDAFEKKEACKLKNSAFYRIFFKEMFKLTWLK
jgi:hypothetical protein